MAHNYIIQWNCRGLRSNKEDIEWLISKYAPAAICLQETMLKPEHTPTFKHYSACYKSNIQVVHGPESETLPPSRDISKLCFSDRYDINV